MHMTENRKVLVVMPSDLIGQADAAADADGISRSEFIRRAVKLYIGQKHKMQIREKMRRGYEQMSHINKEWAEYGTNDDFGTYEAFLAESEDINDKKR